MDVLAGLGALPRLPRPALVAVGVFDGLHRGHAYLLRALVREAARRGAAPVVLTFDHHPDALLTGEAPPLLCDPVERLARLARAGVAATVVEHFDRALRETPFEAFVAQLAARTPLAGFLMTPDAAFGYRRAGTPEALGVLGARDGFAVVTVPPFLLDGGPVRSTAIRDALARGDLAAARRALGRAPAVTGTAGEGSGGPLAAALPVALPPPGRWRAAVEPAWTAAGPAGRARSAVVTVTGEAVVAPAGAAPGDALRVAFRGPA